MNRASTPSTLPRSSSQSSISSLVADLLELALDSLCEDPCWKDPARRYCELRNEAVRLGLREGTLIEMGDGRLNAQRATRNAERSTGNGERRAVTGDISGGLRHK